MRRVFSVLLALSLVMAMSATAFAATGANHIGSYSTVSSDGSCSVTLSATIHVENDAKNLKFPVPKDASNITVNGSRVRASVSGDTRVIDLSRAVKGMTGDFTITIHYTLSDLVSRTESGSLELEMPLLSGFAYPVSGLEFTVTLPGNIDAKPRFTSGYHQADIEKHLSVYVEGPTITGIANQALKDHETLTLLLTVKEEMFPQRILLTPDMAFCNIAAAICAALALLYWLIFLRVGAPKIQAQAASPEGYGPGELGTVLTAQGADLCMMVFAWAQLGYVQLYRPRRGKVQIFKRMDMGNERSSFEQKVFRKLFARGESVNTAGQYFAIMCQQMEKNTGALPELCHKRNGSKKVFRILAALAGLFGGVQLGASLGAGGVLQWFLAVILAGLCFAGSLAVQRWAEGLMLRYRERTWQALILAGLWLLLCALGKVTAMGTAVLWVQVVAGVMATFGGRRTETGRRAMAEALGLRRYLRRITREQVEIGSRNNPEYFFTLLPEAMALGVDRVLAKRFGKHRLPECPYLSTSVGASLTALQWQRLLRDTLREMEERARLLPYQRIIAIIKSFRT